MKFSNMKPLVAYKVTKSSSADTILEGDIIVLCKDNSIISLDDKHDVKWLLYREYTGHREMIDFLCEVSRDYYVEETDGNLKFGYMPTTHGTPPWFRQLQAIQEVENIQENM